MLVEGFATVITVLPTRVGMVPRLMSQCVRQMGSPHPRGDGPQYQARCSNGTGFSPPAWGWSVAA